MDVRLRIAVASEGVNVAAVCRELGISRETFYVWRRRYVAAGLDGLEPRSRAPHGNPRRTPAEIEDRIVELRKELDEAGDYDGPGSIQYRLGKQRVRPVPSEATIWRVLVRRGFVVPQPQKRPTSSYRRFEAARPNELWQADVIDWTIATGVVKVLSFVDDHSRVALRVKALPAATSEATWDTFSEATARWGVPLGQLTDNGMNFSGKLRGFEVHFERQLRRSGVVPKTSRPYHPQTCGKVERFQQTLKKWLRRQPRAADIAELQAQLDTFTRHYNFERPHRGIGRVTPAERWAATPPAINLGVALPSPTRATTATIASNGVLSLGTYQIGIGTHHAGATAVIHQHDLHVAVFIDHRLERVLTIDPTRRYQHTGRPRTGRPRRQPT